VLKTERCEMIRQHRQTGETVPGINPTGKNCVVADTRSPVDL